MSTYTCVFASVHGNWISIGVRFEFIYNAQCNESSWMVYAVLNSFVFLALP